MLQRLTSHFNINLQRGSQLRWIVPARLISDGPTRTAAYDERRVTAKPAQTGVKCGKEKHGEEQTQLREKSVQRCKTDGHLWSCHEAKLIPGTWPDLHHEDVWKCLRCGDIIVIDDIVSRHDFTKWYKGIGPFPVKREQMSMQRGLHNHPNGKIFVKVEYRTLAAMNESPYNYDGTEESFIPWLFDTLSEAEVAQEELECQLEAAGPEKAAQEAERLGLVKVDFYRFGEGCELPRGYVFPNDPADTSP